MKKIIAVICLLFVMGCAKKYSRPSTAPMQPEGTVSQEVTAPETMKEEKMGEIAYAKEGAIQEHELSIDERAKGILSDIHFDYDRYDIRPDARPTLDTIAAFLGKGKDLNLVIEGHCDERGTNEYNLALGERRAKSTKNYLVSRGVTPARMIIITYGEERPMCTDAAESCWQQNRRAHFVTVK